MQNSSLSFVSSIDDFRRVAGIIPPAESIGMKSESQGDKNKHLELSPYSDMLTRSALHDAQLQGLLAQADQPVVAKVKDAPSELFADMFKHNWSIVRAWREYQRLTPVAAAARLGVSALEYANLECVETRVDEAILKNIAKDLSLIFSI